MMRRQLVPTIRTFSAERDFDDVFSLWHICFPQWAMARDVLRRVISKQAQSGADDHLVAAVEDHIVGFIATQVLPAAQSPPRLGSILALMVTPDARGRGLGTALHGAALERLAKRGAQQVQVGGGDPRVWPGVPTDLSTAIAFFSRRGWQWDHTVVDMVRDVRTFTMPRAVQERAVQLQLTFALLTPMEVGELLAFEDREFPHWGRGVREILALGDINDVLVARARTGEIVGTLSLYSAHSHPDRTDVLWKQQLGVDVGALGGVGVAQSVRGRGIGLAMVARGVEVLRERGTRMCFLGWVWASGFYGRLGFQTWRTYAMSMRPLHAVDGSHAETAGDD